MQVNKYTHIYINNIYFYLYHQKMNHVFTIKGTSMSINSLIYCTKTRIFSAQYNNCMYNIITHSVFLCVLLHKHSPYYISIYAFRLIRVCTLCSKYYFLYLPLIMFQDTKQQYGKPVRKRAHTSRNTEFSCCVLY